MAPARAGIVVRRSDDRLGRVIKEVRYYHGRRLWVKWAGYQSQSAVRSCELRPPTDSELQRACQWRAA